MKKVLGVLLSGLMLVTFITGCGSQTKPSESAENNDIEYPSLKIMMSTTVGEQSNAAVVASQFADAVKEASGGKIQITVYPSDQLAGGNMSKGVEMLTSGSINCAFEPVDVLAVMDESLLAMSIPWTFDSYQEAEECLLGTGGEYIHDALEAQGLETLGFIHNGFRQLTNSKRTVTTPDDIKNLKLRVPGGEVFVQCFSALGADPISMSFSELFTGLQQGTVDGQENGFDLIVSNGFYEVQNYITVWNYSYGAFALVFNKATWDSFDENTKALLTEKATEYCRIGNQNVVNNEDAQKQTVVDHGCEVTELTDEQIQAFKDLLIDYYAKMKEKYGEKACAAFGID